MNQQAEPSTPGHQPFEAFVTKLLEPGQISVALQITRSGNTVSISWPVAATGFGLEFASALAPVPDTLTALMPQVGGFETAMIEKQVVLVDPQNRQVAVVIKGEE